MLKWWLCKLLVINLLRDQAIPASGVSLVEELLFLFFILRKTKRTANVWSLSVYQKGRANETLYQVALWDMSEPRFWLSESYQGLKVRSHCFSFDCFSQAPQLYGSVILNNWSTLFKEYSKVPLWSFWVVLQSNVFMSGSQVGFVCTWPWQWFRMIPLIVRWWQNTNKGRKRQRWNRSKT